MNDKGRAWFLGLIAFLLLAPGAFYGLPSGKLVVGATRILQGEVPYRDFWTMYAPGSSYLTAGLFSSLLAFRVAMVWVYDRTGSLPLSVLMHGSLTACALLLTPPTTGGRLLTYDLVLAAGLWAVVAALVVRHDGRRPVATTIFGRTA